MNFSADCAELAMYTLRERQIIVALLAGHQVRHIAGSLQIAPNTVRTFLKAIYVKAQVHSARQLMLKYLPGIGIVSDQRRDTIKRLLATGGGNQLHAATLAMFRAWTGARRILCWEIRSPAAAILVANPQIKSVLVPPGAARAHTAVAITAAQAWREPLLRSAAVGRPFQGDLLLLRLRLLRRSWLVALADSKDGYFVPDAARLVNALVCIAGCHAEISEPSRAPVAAVEPALASTP